jgi:hypothetical protein
MSLDFVREVADDLREMFRQGPMREHAPRSWAREDVRIEYVPERASLRLHRE